MDMGLKLKNRKVLFLGKLYIYFEERVIAINENIRRTLNGLCIDLLLLLYFVCILLKLLVSCNVLTQ